MKQKILMRLLAHITLVMTACAPLLLGSCLRDNLDDCPPDYNVRLLVKTDYEVESSRAAARQEWYDNTIECLIIYVFDEDDRYVTSWSGGAYTLGEEYLVPLKLEEGRTYSFVAWTNHGDIYSHSHEGEDLHGMTREELRIMLNVPEDGCFREDIPHRHQGVLDGVSIEAESDNEHTIIISPHTYKVNFVVRGLTANDDINEVAVTDSNTHHDCDLGWSHGDSYRHVRELATQSRAASETSASMILLQIGDETTTTYDLDNTTDGRHLHTGDLLDTIGKAYGGGTHIGDDALQELLQQEYEYTIILEFSSLGLTISVNGWSYEHDPIDL